VDVLEHFIAYGKYREIPKVFKFNVVIVDSAKIYTTALFANQQTWRLIYYFEVGVG
jgi:hypothetical protein